MRKRSEYTRLTILAIAKELFMNFGYSTTSLDNIAEKAGITKKTIYGYYPDKRSILAGVVDEVIGDDINQIKPLNEISNVEDVNMELYRIAKTINKSLFRPQYIQLLRVGISEINVQTDLKVLLERGVTNRAHALTIETLTTAANKNIIKIKNAEHSSQMFVGGFLLKAFINGLLDPSYVNLREMSQSELIQYVNEFISVTYLRDQKTKK